MIENRTPNYNPEYHLEKMDDEILLYSLAGTKAMYLNESASLIWELCDGNRTVKEIVTLLEQSYPQKKEQISQDVIATIQALVENGAMTLNNH